MYQQAANKLLSLSQQSQMQLHDIIKEALENTIASIKILCMVTVSSVASYNKYQD